MASVEFKDYRIEVKSSINEALISSLYEASGEIVSQTQRNTRVDTGQLKGSWTYNVDESALEATIGSPLENAIWEEFGTGIYALNGDGRKTAWVYTDRHGVKHTTRGKKGTRAFYKAMTSLKSAITKMFENRMKGLN